MNLAYQPSTYHGKDFHHFKNWLRLYQLSSTSQSTGDRKWKIKFKFSANLPEVNFLDARFDLRTKTYRLCGKPSNTPSYKHMLSNHPLESLKRLPTSIRELLSKNSFKKHILDSVKSEYEEALYKSGYQASLEYIQPKGDNIENNTNKLQRKRKKIWFKPLFNKSLTTNVGGKFLNLVEKHLPNERKLHKVFNKNTLKVSYSCSKNMTHIIKSLNKS